VKGTKDSARPLISGLPDFDAASHLPLAFHPQRKPHRKEGMQADQIAGIQHYLLSTSKVTIKLRGVAVVP
jgi:hypothetical protein